MENIKELKEEIKLYQQLRYEQDSYSFEDINNLNELELKNLLNTLKNEASHPQEPNDLKSILDFSELDLSSYPVNNYLEKLKGAIIGRFVGCLLGVPVEGYSIEYMEQLAKQTGTPFPPTEYWHDIDKDENWIQYGIDKRKNYTLNRMNACLVDDDINFTILNLLLLDKYGKDYTLSDIGEFWINYLPYACTAEDRALKNLKKGVTCNLVAEDNPFIEWIGAAIRADAFAYIYPGEPLKAAKCCYNDAYLTHRRNGIYGEMFLAASISSSFASETPLDALKIGMKFIPKESRLYKELKWAMSYENKTFTFKEARKLIDERFPGMNSVHTINNMCAIVFVTILAGNNYDKAISLAVALGLDNDCTAASIGSLYGANLGINKIDAKWYRCFNNIVHTFINGLPEISIDDIINLVLKIKNT